MICLCYDSVIFTWKFTSQLRATKIVGSFLFWSAFDPFFLMWHIDTGNATSNNYVQRLRGAPHRLKVLVFIFEVFFRSQLKCIQKMFIRYGQKCGFAYASTYLDKHKCNYVVETQDASFHVINQRYNNFWNFLCNYLR